MVNRLMTYAINCITKMINTKNRNFPLISSYGKKIDDGVGNDNGSQKIEFKNNVNHKQKLQTATNVITVNAQNLGDIPVKYTIRKPDTHQLPVIGMYIDKRIVPGFKYRVRELCSYNKPNARDKFLFNDKSLPLESIGRGFARKITFRSEIGHHNNNENYFYTDNARYGYFFEIQMISEGDKFTIFDSKQQAHGTVEVVSVKNEQVEKESFVRNGHLVKVLNVQFVGKVNFFDNGHGDITELLDTNVYCTKTNASNAEVMSINTTIRRRRYILIPGIFTINRKISVCGSEIDDIPTNYVVNGIEEFEMPVIGTYIDRRILPGFSYVVRSLRDNKYLFSGESLKLVSIGRGYGKRITFESNSRICSNNHMWSDSCLAGFGFSIKVLHVGMNFAITTSEYQLGRATVFRADKPQIELSMKKKTNDHEIPLIEKTVLIDVICYIELKSSPKNQVGQLVRVCGTAIVHKQTDWNEARVIRVEDLGLDSQINVFFNRQKEKPIFLPTNSI